MTHPEILLLSFLAVILTLGAGLIPVIKTWKEDHLHGFVCFSAGVLLSTAFLHLLPDALERAPATEVGFSILASFLFLFVLEKFIMLHPCEETHCDYHTMGKAAFVGMTIHTFFDGFALGSAGVVKNLGGIVFLAIMAHKIPSSFSLASILKKANWSTAKITLSLFIFGFVIPVGAVTSNFFLNLVGEKTVGIALSLSLGTFLYISTSDFLPEVHRAQERRFKNLAAFVAGIALMTGLALVLPD